MQAPSFIAEIVTELASQAVTSSEAKSHDGNTKKEPRKDSFAPNIPKRRKIATATETPSSVMGPSRGEGAILVQPKNKDLAKVFLPRVKNLGEKDIDDAFSGMSHFRVLNILYVA